MRLSDAAGIAHGVGVFTLRKFRAEDYDAEAGRLRDGAVPYSIREVGRNLILEEGNDALLLLLIGDGAGVPYSNANAKIGVGNNGTAPARSQTGLIGGNKLYKAMEASYPLISDHKVVFRSLFIDTEAEFEWCEATVTNDTDDSGDNIGRCVFETPETKGTGTIWQLDYTLIFY